MIITTSKNLAPQLISHDGVPFFFFSLGCFMLRALWLGICCNWIVLFLWERATKTGAGVSCAPKGRKWERLWEWFCTTHNTRKLENGSPRGLGKSANREARRIGIEGRECFSCGGCMGDHGDRRSLIRVSAVEFERDTET